MRTTMVALAVLAVTSGAAAQEKAAEEPRTVPAAQAQDAEETRETPRPSIRVLRNPYDISSFYRSGESPLGHVDIHPARILPTQGCQGAGMVGNHRNS